MTTTVARRAVDAIPSLPNYAMTVAAVPGTWTIAAVRPRSEKEVARDLHDAGFGYFLPLLKKVDGWRKTRYLPIRTLQGCVFCASTGDIVPGYDIPTDLFYFLDDHPAVIRSRTPIAAGRQSRFVRELEYIYAKVVDTPNYDDWEKPFLAADRKYKVRAGPFKGQPAKIDREGKRGRVWVLIQSMGRSVPLEVLPSDLEPAD